MEKLDYHVRLPVSVPQSYRAAIDSVFAETRLTTSAIVQAALEMYFKNKHSIVLTKFDGRRKDG